MGPRPVSTTRRRCHPVFEQLRAERRVFSDLITYVPLGLNQVAVRYGTEAEAAVADMVTGNFFSGLRVTMERGRSFTMDDEEQHTQNAVISYGYWARRLGRRADAIGSALFVKGVPFTIVGITGPEFVGLGRGRATDVWCPIQLRPELKPWDVRLSRATPSTAAPTGGS